MEQVKTKSVEPQQRYALPEVSWDELNEPGAYVERGSGDLYRIPKEALIPGGSPIIHKEKHRGIASGASKQKSVRDYTGSSLVLCPTQHRTKLLEPVRVPGLSGLRIISQLTLRDLPLP